jgi:hypothetical protein
MMNTRGRGASCARNMGAEHADTPLAAFLLDDVLVHEDRLSRLIDPLADPAVVVRSVVRNVSSQNMAVRTDFFRAVGGFRSDFRKVGARSSPEDTGLCIRIAASVAGAGWVYTPDAIVEHHVPVARASFPYFLKRNYLEGGGTLEMARSLGRQQKLQDERDYLHRTLPSGMAPGIRTALRDCKMSSSGWQSVK